MTFTKHMVLLGGVLALVAFFLPYGTIRSGSNWIKVSAFDVMKRIDSLDQISNVHGNDEIDRELAQSVDNSATKGYTLLVFGPPLLLLALGGLGLARNKFGRLAGLGALILGAWACVFAAALMAVIDKDGSEGAAVGGGTYVFLAAGALGALGGLLALIKPDRGAF
jgi:hypothetical protein